MEKITKTINNVVDVMEQNIRGVQIGCYSVALIGLTVAIRKVRPFSKFKKPSDIPNHFIKEKKELSGLVSGIDPNGGILMVQHKPLINLPIISTGLLPVKISGVKVSGLGLTWLQALVTGSEVKFIPVAKEKDYIQCQVLLLQTYKDKKQQLQIREINVGENLVKIGFGTREEIGKPLIEDPIFLRYYKTLQNAENIALRKELGLKYYMKPTKQILKILAQQVANLKVLAKKGIALAPTRLTKLYQA